MATYVVMEPPGRSEKADATAFVRDGFTWLGLLVPPLWFAWHRLWIEAALTFVVMGLLSMLGQKLGLGLAGSLLSLLVSLYVGLEGQGLRIAALRRRGWHEWGAVEAGWLDDADTRYALEAEALADEVVPAPRMVPDAAFARPAQPGIALGLTHIPGRN
ncbi:DUF2628 domain-containing protein [Mesorhizobium sp. M7A.F.Ca.US.006.04.2.1]|uniref:DUF2628 domain-containing protein n=1 Tax=unclassified Mesorhizobium TaxID=325217 RepID=UPI000FCA45E9|nr:MULTISPECIES: DUF2628 domain-containing protein [unclassified Mesorhizobium]RUX77745.1 DUF2628 domain-containing protein [Mesorhizobium sp. M7A.F.Ca.US.005.03.1.1]RUY13637.1 DUF2628 domain-containing protein [Mesorhizobium sp. M7A.F.Ca.US.005.03.2.1]RUY30693.1 DUF2628 domain-containing protein [Mesorhizobium sp. M7A.F.Ca.US.001.04.2.1]RUY45520.1 DUF2628 domain-containing protein [Mesorhizobium sp. M7A.F.Ca.US.001.04.1.1]RVA01457.1 DUF2628 domain-containing protein [Mesorhizobium sp. M7A.F.C